MFNPHGKGTLESMLNLESAQLGVESRFYCFCSVSWPLKASISTFENGAIMSIAKLLKGIKETMYVDHIAHDSP